MKIERKAAFDGPNTPNDGALFQVAAFCVRNGPDGPEVLLITSSENRWIFPKGWPMDGKSDAEAAQIEAWEEAGVKAKAVSETPIARLETLKDRGNGSFDPLFLDLYEIEVDRLSKSYPEATKRDRRWVPLQHAAEEVDDPAMRDFLASL